MVVEEEGGGSGGRTPKINNIVRKGEKNRWKVLVWLLLSLFFARKQLHKYITFSQFVIIVIYIDIAPSVTDLNSL